jgi:hypothetical protein
VPGRGFFHKPACARAASQLCFPCPPLRASPRACARAQLCASPPLRGTVSRRFFKTGFPPAFMPGPPHPRQRCPPVFPSRLREGCIPTVHAFPPSHFPPGFPSRLREGCIPTVPSHPAPVTPVSKPEPPDSQHPAAAAPPAPAPAVQNAPGDAHCPQTTQDCLPAASASCRTAKTSFCETNRKTSNYTVNQQLAAHWPVPAAPVPPPGRTMPP